MTYREVNFAIRAIGERQKKELSMEALIHRIDLKIPKEDDEEKDFEEAVEETDKALDQIVSERNQQRHPRYGK